jgi:hypothetical protein
MSDKAAREVIEAGAREVEALGRDRGARRV